MFYCRKELFWRFRSRSNLECLSGNFYIMAFFFYNIYNNFLWSFFFSSSTHSLTPPPQIKFQQNTRDRDQAEVLPQLFKMLADITYSMTGGQRQLLMDSILSMSPLEFKGILGEEVLSCVLFHCLSLSFDPSLFLFSNFFKQLCNI